MQINPYLQFDGTCEAAFSFYEKALNGKILFVVRYDSSPMADQTPAEMKNKIMHMRMAVDGNIIMGSDAPCGRFEAAKGIMINLGYDEPADADRVFAALSEGGTINMPIQETFWARRFGMFVDKFGIPWMVNCEKKQG